MPKMPNYGIDAPIVVRNNTLVGLLLIAIALATFFALAKNHRDLAFDISARIGITGTIFLALAAYMLWSSKVAKFNIAKRLISAIPWRGDEQVLDIGCGRGLALITAAKQLSNGRAVGIDLWSRIDLSGNTAEATRANARAEHVADKIRLETADARALPFADDSFDVVISMTALHNIKDRRGRETALSEAVRVLKSGGRIAIFDIFRSSEYRIWLRQNRMDAITSSRLYLLWMIPGRILTAQKPVIPNQT